MADEPDDEEVELEVETEACPDWFEIDGGYIVAPRGWADVQDHFGSPLIRIKSKPGTVEVLTSADDGMTWVWRAVDKLKVSADIRAIKGDKP